MINVHFIFGLTPHLWKIICKCNTIFFFSINLFFSFRLLLTREELDNPHKAKTWHIFQEKFSVSLLFNSEE
jgi:PTEN phosphatase family protein